jgi:hypothetical protein
MSRALQFQLRANVAIGGQDFHDSIPHRYPLVGASVPNDVHAMLGTRQQNVDTVRGLEEATILLRITSHHGDNNNLGFFTLEVINSRY